MRRPGFGSILDFVRERFRPVRQLRYLKILHASWVTSYLFIGMSFVPLCDTAGAALFRESLTTPGYVDRCSTTE